MWSMEWSVGEFDIRRRFPVAVSVALTMGSSIAARDISYQDDKDKQRHRQSRAYVRNSGFHVLTAGIIELAMTQVTARNILVFRDLAVPPRSLLEAIERGTC
jgi:hypothetical protein